MAEIKEATGIVLKKIDYSNTSLIFHLFSADEGMIHLIARGAKSAKSSFRGRIELFNELHCHYLVSPKTTLYTLKECSTLTRYSNISLDPEIFVMTSFMAESISLFPWDKHESGQVYNSIKTTLEFFQNQSDVQYNTLSLLYFTACLLRYLGYQPDTGRCCRTGIKLNSHAYPVYSPVPGFAHRSAITAQECKHTPPPADDALRSQLDHVMTTDNLHTLFKTPMQQINGHALLDMCVFFLNGLSDKKLRTLKSLQSMGIIRVS